MFLNEIVQAHSSGGKYLCKKHIHRHTHTTHTLARALYFVCLFANDSNEPTNAHTSGNCFLGIFRSNPKQRHGGSHFNPEKKKKLKENITTLPPCFLPPTCHPDLVCKRALCVCVLRQPRFHGEGGCVRSSDYCSTSNKKSERERERASPT